MFSTNIKISANEVVEPVKLRQCMSFTYFRFVEDQDVARKCDVCVVLPSAIKGSLDIWNISAVRIIDYCRDDALFDAKVNIIKNIRLVEE